MQSFTSACWQSESPCLEAQSCLLKALGTLSVIRLLRFQYDMTQSSCVRPAGKTRRLTCAVHAECSPQQGPGQQRSPPVVACAARSPAAGAWRCHACQGARPHPLAHRAPAGELVMFAAVAAPQLQPRPPSKVYGSMYAEVYDRVRVKVFQLHGCPHVQVQPPHDRFV